MEDESHRPKPRTRLTGPEAVAWALTALAAAYVLAAGVTWLVHRPKAREKARRIHCAHNLKSIGLALRAYGGDHDEHFPDDFAMLAATGWGNCMQHYTCPSTNTEHAPNAEAFRPDQHLDYLYFGKGLTEDCRGCDPEKTIIACDRRGNHERFLNVMVATGWTRGFEGDSVEEIADREGLFLPGHNMPDQENAAPE